MEPQISNYLFLRYKCYIDPKFSVTIMYVWGRSLHVPVKGLPILLSSPWKTASVASPAALLFFRGLLLIRWGDSTLLEFIVPLSLAPRGKFITILGCTKREVKKWERSTYYNPMITDRVSKKKDLQKDWSFFYKILRKEKCSFFSRKYCVVEVTSNRALSNNNYGTNITLTMLNDWEDWQA